MRTAAIGTGSIADQLNAVAIILHGFADLAELEYRWPRLVRSLEALGNRAASVRARGGMPLGLDGPLDLLRQVVRDHPAFAEPGGEPLRVELLGLARRIAPGR